eukprot:467529-Prymnesium_polylepis.1
MQSPAQPGPPRSPRVCYFCFPICCIVTLPCSLYPAAMILVPCCDDFVRARVTPQVKECLTREASRSLRVHDNGVGGEQAGSCVWIHA